MELIGCIRTRIGSCYKEELNDKALAKYAELKGLDPRLLVSEANSANYDYYECKSLCQAIQTNEDWRKINWCYAFVAWQQIQNKNKIPTSLGMKLLSCTRKEDFDRQYPPVTKLDIRVDRYGCEVRKSDGQTIRTIRDKTQTDTEAWAERVSSVLRHIFEDDTNPRFDPKEMRESDNEYCFYRYELTFGRTKMSFNTTEKGFDVFSSIRDEISDNLTPAALDLLGEYAGILH